MQDDLRWGIFGGTWICLGIAMKWIYSQSKDVARKRVAHRYFTWGIPPLFCFFVWFTTQQIQPLLIVAPFCILFMWLGLRYPPLFCDTCGATSHPKPLAKTKFCPMCGAAIKK